MPLADSQSRSQKLPPSLEVYFQDGGHFMVPRGDWTINNLVELEASLVEFITDSFSGSWVMDFRELQQIDTAGAWLIARIVKAIKAQGVAIEFANLSKRRTLLISTIAEIDVTAPKVEFKALWRRFFEGLGRHTVAIGNDIVELLNILGYVLVIFKRMILSPSKIRVTSIVHHLNRSGVQAVGIVGLISFLVGAIIAQQAAYQLRNFGAEIFVVNMIGILVLREVGLLLAAIMVAGRSGSAFTSEIGSMRMREEVDAVKMIGLEPVEVLVMPRLIALIAALPLLTVIADIAGIAGGMTASWVYSDISPRVFLLSLNNAVTVETMAVGLVKAPVMALLIGLVACVEGFKVEGSSQSLGYHTTASVVRSIFLVIVLDGIFAIFFVAIEF